MRILAVVISCLAIGACSQSQDAQAHAQAEQAREKMHQTADQVRADSRVALRQAEVDTARASQDLNRDLEKTRDKMRKALDVPPSGSDRTDDQTDRR
jgi:Tfp pilus assembly protein PilP